MSNKLSLSLVVRGGVVLVVQAVRLGLGEWLWQAGHKIRLFEATIDDGTNMIFHYANGSISGIERLGGRCCYSKEQSYGQRTSNLAFLSVRKGRTAGGIRLVTTDIMVVMRISLLTNWINSYWASRYLLIWWWATHAKLGMDVG